MMLFRSYFMGLSLQMIVFSVCLQWGNVQAIDLTKCRVSLGMESMEIPDSAITASSSYDVSVGPQSARIRTETKGGAWCPRNAITRNSYEYLQIDFSRLTVITMVEVAGRFGNGMGTEYTKEFLLEYQREDGEEWMRFRSKTGQERFRGNTNTYMTNLREVSPPIVCKRIRFVPNVSGHTPSVSCLRVELYGCPSSDGLMSYSMRRGEKRGAYLEFYDFTYDGTITTEYLTNGLGQLVDGEVGPSNFRLDPAFHGFKGYHWVGWQNELLTDTAQVEITFQFDTVRQFSTVNIHCNNLFSKNIRIFRLVVTQYSIGGKYYKQKNEPFEFMRDVVVEYARWVPIPLNVVARFVKLRLYFDAKWMLISEVVFDSEPFIGNFAEEEEGEGAPPVVSSTGIPQSAVSQSDVVLSCQSYGDPTPSWSWTNPLGHNITSCSAYQVRDNTLKITLANQDTDMGQWVCTACNLFGCDSETVELVIEGPPKISSFHGNKKSGIVTLTCEATGIPEPTVTWTSNVVPMASSQVEHTVVVPENDCVKPKYTCEAINTYGVLTKTVTVPGQITDSPTVKALEPGQVTLTWPRLDDSGNLPLTDYKVQVIFDLGNSWRDVIIEILSESDVQTEQEVNVTGLSPFTHYTFRVAAVNILGTGPYSESSSRVQTLSGVPSQPTNVHVVALEMCQNSKLITWDPPANLNGPESQIIYQYEITRPSSDEGADSVIHSQGTVLSNQSHHVELTDLTDSVVYTVSLWAHNTILNIQGKPITLNIM